MRLFERAAVPPRKISWNPVRAAVAVAALALIFIGCGDVFRPVAIPITTPGGDPSVQHRAVVVNQNTSSTGTTTEINVSGDTIMAVRPLGLLPVHAATLPNGAETFVANSGDDTVSSFNTFSGPGNDPTVTVLPTGSRPSFVMVGAGDNMFVAAPGLNTVHVVSIGNFVLTKSIPVGSAPAAIVQVPDGSKVYVINQGDGSVSVIGVPDLAVTNTIRVGSNPTAAAISTNGAQLYVANTGSNSVSVIDTTSDTVTATIPVGAAPGFIIWDKSLSRVYVANTGSNSISIIRGDQQPASLLTTVSVGQSPVSIAALPDGTRVYVANSGSNNVSVINTTNNAVTRTVAVGQRPVSIGAGDSNKVMVANRDSNNISAIGTATDTVVATINTSSPRPVFLLVTQ
jgi:YVTN family beta-propeller protein